MKTKKIRWCFLLCLFFTCPNLSWAQNEAKVNEAGEKISVEKPPLDLIFRKMDAADFNGSAYTISASDIRNLPVTSLSNLLSGIVPGFYSRQTQGGMVNAGSSYWIRGIRTYSEGVLVLVDGQERDFGVLSTHEIESITVLKDAAAVVLYGMRGANGIILVNTRKGTIGKPSIDLTAQLINQQPVNMMKPLSALGYAENYNAALKNDGLDETKMYSQSYLSNYRNRTGANPELYPDINWLDKYYKRNNLLQRYNMNISGGTERTRYFVNIGSLTQPGMFKTDDEFSYNTNNNISRYNVRSNVEFDVTPTTLLKVDLYGWFERQNRPGGDSYGAYNALAITPPNSFPSYYADNGNYIDQSGNAITGLNGKIVAGNGISANPWALLNRSGYATYASTYGSFRTQLTQDLSALLKGLKFSTIFSMDSQTEAVATRTKSFAYYQLVDPLKPNVLKKTGADGKMTNTVDSKNSLSRKSLDIQLSYAAQVGKHGISALAYYNQYENTDEVSIPDRFQGGGAWLNYNFDKRFSLDLMASEQGSYKFAPEHRFGFFPTIAAGWTLSNESFFKSLKNFMPFLKLRASYGILGNQRGVSEFSYMGRLASTTAIYQFGNAMGTVNGYVENIIANPGLTWETSKQGNVGVEAKMFGNRLSVTAEYFNDDRSNIFMVDNRISSLLGITAIVEKNVGSMYTNGCDISSMWNSKIGAVGYNIGGTYSFSRNKVTALGEVDQPYPWLSNVGYFKDIKRGYIADGFFGSYDEIAAAPTQTFSKVKPGDIRYKDVNGDGIIDFNDKVPMGYGDTPQIVYGFTLGITYKGLGISAVLQGAARVSRTISGRAAFPFFANGNIYENQLNYWKQELRNAELPGLSTITSGNANNIQPSSLWIRNADYLRLNTVEVYYDVPRTVLKSGFVKNLRVFANGYNLFTWTNYNSPLDPQADETGSGMPVTRNFSLGCSIKF